MVKRLIWSKSAVQDRKNILDYWNETNENKNYSRKLNNEFNDLTELLLLFPLLGRKVENHNSRFVVKGEYIIFYKISENKEITNIEILHIWDSRRDPMKLKLQ